ncbi:MAG: sensor histidine kinase KdpD [Legionella sp.]|jgi:two-component system sensor histidine kinase KdpD
MVNQRQSPEKLLERAEEEERKERRGKLKIYLGSAPGVGKTYAMLHDAIAIRSEDLDVVVGVVESHGREEIETLLGQLEKLPRQIVEYHGKLCQEFNLDAALQRHPGLILVDEMAHTNAPEMRHEKRWQDIKELLDRGIDVYTTLNVQHIESLKDDIAQIIQAPIKETVPNSMIERADTIELIDLPVEELLKRLQEGKIYIPQQAEIAKEHFFRKGNLIALRELALRITAARVGTDVLLYRHDEGIKKIWPIKDKIVVCVGPRPESRNMIRSAKRIATSLQADWLAVYVDRPRIRSSAQQRNNAIQNLRLAELLGAETYVLTGFDIVKEILNFAREHNATQIMLWKRIGTRWQSLFHRSLVDEVLRYSGEIDVYVKTGPESKQPMQGTIGPPPIPWESYGITLGVISLVTFIGVMIRSMVAPSNIVIIYLLGVAVTATLGRIGPSVFASILSVVAYDYFFVPPYYTFALSNFEYVLTLIVMLIVSEVISYSTILARRQAESLRAKQHQTESLYILNRKLAITQGVTNLLEMGVNYIAEVFNSEVVALLPTKNNQLKVQAIGAYTKDLDVKEQSIAQWVYTMRQNAGFGTDTLTFSNAIYLPMLGRSGAIGVLRIQPKDGQLFSPEQLKLLESCINQIALAIELARLQEKERKEHLQLEADKARSSLLQAIFHDLCFPLKQVIKAVDSLKEIEGAKLRIIEANIDHEIDKLNRLNNNLHLAIQLETQAIKLNKTLQSLQKLIQKVIKKCHDLFGNRDVVTDIDKSTPLVLLDQDLIQEVFMHLFDNAVKFSPPNTPIHIFVHTEPHQVKISIEDFGAGISIDEKHKVFEKFYRGKAVLTEHGLGLGLAICQKIIHEHNGTIWVENIENKGAAFRFTLPV